jgi:uncharacterized protein YdeI (YjbR/CyaY-like superfamily)
MITEVEVYFAKGCGRCARFDTSGCATQLWAEGLAALRRLCLEGGLMETVKWGQPCYMANGRNVVILGALKTDFRLSFFNPALMRDPKGVLERAGPNTRHAGMMRFTESAQVAAMAPVIRAYLDEARAYAQAGILPQRETADLELPDDLMDMLDADPELAEAFHALTAGRQRSYVISMSSAKRPETRVPRIVKLRGHILNGKGATER